MNKNYIIVALSLSLLLILNTVHATVVLPKLISNGMVLQREKPIDIWGWADANETLEIHFIDSMYWVQADASGNWKLKLPAHKAGGPYTLEIKATNTLTINNILFGDVWICSGQSNMELPIRRVSWNYPEEIENCNNDKIRQFLVPHTYNFNQSYTDFSDGSWKSATPETIMDFTAVGYFYAKELFQKYQIPIGLINTSLGGSPAEAWMSEDALLEFPMLFAEMQKFKDTTFENQIRKDDNQRIGKWYQESIQKDAGYQNPELTWRAANLNDSNWQEIEIPGLWTNTNLEKINGVVWFRKKFTISKDTDLSDALLILGRIVDADSVFINGVFVGKTSYQHPPRRYPIPTNLIQKGENTLVVRVINSSGVGGFVTNKNYEIQFKNHTLQLEGTWKYKLGAEMPALARQTFIRWKPGGLFNAMLAPLFNYSIKGVIWYQGESNADRPMEYRTLFPSMIADWRNQFNQGNFPFVFVQLANYMDAKPEPSESDWALLRESQYKTLQVPNTAMATLIDIGEANDIHPLNKKDVGYRLALAAKHLAYSEKEIIFSGPTYHSMQIEGNKIILTFDNIGSGIISQKGVLKQFAIAGIDKEFIWAHAKIQGDKIVVWSDSVKKPVAVRYAWADNPEGANLYNKEGLPAVPFRTDVW
jgi:sialate O-acetylesterase